MGKWKLRSRDVVESGDIVGFVGEGTVFTGELSLKGGARIDGRVVGKIIAPDTLIIGPAGEIEAEELRANHVTVCGVVRGTLYVQDRLEIQAGGRVSGRVVMEKEGLVVAPGGLFEGAVEYARTEERATGSHRDLIVEAAV